MQIEMASSQADDLIQESYTGASKPMSKLTASDNVHSLDWWIENPKVEDTWQERKIAAIRALFQISSASQIELPRNSFPAQFDFSDGAMRRPDKGQVKSLMASGQLCARMLDGELLFQLTEDPRNSEFLIRD